MGRHPMTEAAANIPWLSLPEAVARVARHLGCTPEAAELQIVDKGKGSRIKARGVIEGQPVPLQIVGEGKSSRITVATMKPRDVSCEITNVELLFIDLIAAGLLPAPAEKARWPAEEANAYLVKGVPLPWRAWHGQGASPAEIEQAEIDLGQAIADGVPAWGRPGRFAPERPIPASDFRPDMIENKALPMSVAHQPKVVVRIGGTVGVSPPQRRADYNGSPWSSIEIDSAALRQAHPRPAEPEQASPIESPRVEPVPPPKPTSADARASRRRRNWESGAGSGAQTLRARAVLKRLYGGPAKYPTREEVRDADLYDRFVEEYKKVEGKAKPSSKWGIPSRATVLREVGRQVD